MAATKDCPLCGGSMKIKKTQSTTKIPGNPKPNVRAVREWVCPDCDYFEEPGENDEADGKT
jgi:YgiT-type zinc finger domain-containing protein